MKAKNPIIKRILTLLMCIAIMLPSVTALVGRDGTAEALISLPFVESLKSSGGAFKILEIVPDATQGSLGYYIAGQEPGLNWQVEAAKKGSFAERSAFVSSFFGALEAGGLLGTGTNTPLKSTGTYTERFPWETPLTDFTPLALEKEETSYINGSFKEASADLTKNVFNEITSYKILAPSGTPSTHVQNIIRFDYYPSAAEAPLDTTLADTFWYSAPSFELAPDITAVPNDTHVYSSKGDTGPFEYAGIAGVSVEIIGDDENYYTIKDLEKTKFTVRDDWSEATPYFSVSDGFKKPLLGQEAYFYAASTYYSYVGTGGTHYFTADGSGNKEVRYSTIFYKGGFTNNDWFLQHVFDWSTEKTADGEFVEPRPTKTLLVDTKTPDTLTLTDIQGASLIVLSGGFNPAGAAENFTSDLSYKAFTEIGDLCNPSDGTRGRPLIVDTSLQNSDSVPNIMMLAYTSLSENAVFNNVYGTDSPLATNNFNSAIGTFESHSDTSSPFYPVYNGIKSVNFYRETVSGEAELPEIVSIATAIRQILNYSGGAALEKSKINVLSLQPGVGDDLSLDAVASWLNLPKYQIEISTMSTAEFIGKIDDVSERYDLVYIGAHSAKVGSSPNNANGTDYNDNAMDGLIYSSIGDTVISGSPYTSSGLLDRDYNSKSQVILNETSRTFRYPGNDITSVALKKLNSFVASGYPVVVASNLLGGGISTTTGTDVQGRADCYSQETKLGTSLFSAPLIIDEEKKTLSVSIENVPSGDFGDVTVAKYQWLECTDGSNAFVPFKGAGSSGTLTTKSSSISVSSYPAGSKFKCTVTPTTVKQLSFNYPGDNQTLRNITPATSRTATLPGERDIDPAKVDNCSYMYEFLTSNLSKPNVLPSNDPTIETNLKPFVDIAKPEIVFSKTPDGNPMYPTVYQNSDGSVSSLTPVDGACTLDYTFRVIGPDTATYTCNLYIDGNGDGRYSEDEKLSDITVREKSNGIIRDAVDSGALSSGQEYFITRRLPLTQVGIVPWKLEIVKNTTAGVTPTRASFRSYSHVKPSEGTQPVIKILQIDSTRGYDKIDLQDHMTVVKENGNPSDAFYSSVTKKTYKGIYGKLFADVTDFKVEITHILGDEIAAKANGDIDAYFNSFNMLVLGFDDAYRGVPVDAIKALLKYQKDPSHALLVTHDNTSFYFAPKDQTSSSGDSLYSSLGNWVGGYQFNMLVRNTIGMDVYGLADPVYGFSSFRTDIRPATANGLVASSRYLDLTSAERAALVSSGYRIAYKPRSGIRDSDGSLTSFSTVPETHGLSTGILIRYYKGGGKPTTDNYKNASNNDHMETTTTISQINEGQITSYPYNINTAAFKPWAASGASNRMRVATTHYQYLQLNMNDEDIVVWYTLAGGEYDYYKNDVSNSYYIYNKGNVTYSGAGHTTNAADVNANVDEAKLFVNTMIAAYRVTNIKPEARFTDKNGTTDISSFLVPTDNGLLLPSLSTDPDLKSYNDNRKIFFALYDATVVAKTLSASFTWKMSTDTDEKLLGIPTIYDAQTAAPVTEKSLTSGRTYYVTLDEIISKIGKDNINNNTIQLLVTAARTTVDATGKATTVHSPSADILELRTLDLFNLS